MKKLKKNWQMPFTRAVSPMPAKKPNCVKPSGFIKTILFFTPYRKALAITPLSVTGSRDSER